MRRLNLIILLFTLSGFINTINSQAPAWDFIEAETGGSTGSTSTVGAGYNCTGNCNNGIRRVAVSPDNQNVYAMSWFGKGLLSYTINPADGSLTHFQDYGSELFAANEWGQPEEITLSPDGTSLYLTTVGKNGVWWFSRAGDGTLTYQAKYRNINAMFPSTNRMTQPMAVTVHPNGLYVYVSGNGGITRLNRAAGGALSYTDAGGWTADGSACGGVEFGRAQEMTISPDGNYLYMATPGTNQNGVTVWSINGSGALSLIQAIRYTGAICGGTEANAEFSAPYWVKINSTGDRLYLATATGRSVIVYERFPGTGLLNTTLRMARSVGGASEFTGGLSVLSDDSQVLTSIGNDMYAWPISATGDLDLANEFIATNGAGSPVVSQMAWTRHMVISPNDQFAYLASYNDDAVVVFHNVTPLAVRLDDFTGKHVGEGLIELKWNTLSEENNRQFEILRSEDGSNFEAVGVISGYGSSYQNSEYEFIDNPSLNKSGYYYRLNQVDFDGTSKLSKVVFVPVDKPCDLGVVYDGSNHVIHAFSGNDCTEASNNLSIEVYDLSAKRIISAKENASTMQMDVQRLKPGMYLVLVRDGVKTYKKKIIIQ